jgi:flagellar protein FlbT
VALKIELKPNERILLGDCVITNADQRTRFVIDGSLPVLREKDIMSLGRANSLAKLVYLAVQFIYLAKRPQDHHALYFQLADEFLRRAPSARPHIETISDRISKGEPYKALKDAKKLIAYEKEHLKVHHASNTDATIAIETVPAREREASLLLQAAAKLQAVQDSSRDKPSGLNDALLFNRRLWTVFLEAVTSEGNKLPEPVRENIRRLGTFVLAETLSLMTKPTPDHLTSIIKINRGIAAGLRGKA